MEKHNNRHRTLTVMEGREKNAPMVEGFKNAAKKKGWSFCQLLGINSDKLARFDFEDVPLDYVIFRELSRNNYHEAERIMYWLKANHKICVNVDVAGRRISTSDKHFQQGLFMMDPFIKEYALPTFEAKNKGNVISYIEGGRVHYPIVLKDRRGTAGKNITLINSDSELDNVSDFKDLLIEQYIRPECDYRVFVMGGAAIGTMRKKGNTDNPGDFISWSAGIEKHPEEDPTTLAQLSEIATRAAAISKLEYAGIDILREEGTGKLYLLETNIAAGWPNFIPVTHIDIPMLVLDWMEEIGDNLNLPPSTTVPKYIENRLKYLPASIQESYHQILDGTPDVLEQYQALFDKYPNRYLYDAGNIFARLKDAYQTLISSPEKAGDYNQLLTEIESMPLSWAGNFIGPEVGTLHDGAILSALYLFLLHKIKEI